MPTPVRAVAAALFLMLLASAGWGCSPRLQVEPIEIVLRVEGSGEGAGLPVSVEGSVPVRSAGGEALPVRTTSDSEVGIKSPSVRYEGTYVSEDLMQRVQVGETSAEWVLAVIGEPMYRTTLSDGSEIWRWEFRPLDAGGSLLGLGGSEEPPQPTPIIAFVRVRDGIVVDKFRG